MNFNKTLAELTKNEGYIASLRDLMQKTLLGESVALAQTYNLRAGVNTGDKLGYIGKMDDLGWAGSGCDPEYKHASVNFDEKAWALGEWQLPLKWCYKEFENTIAQYALRKGTDIAKLEGTEIWSVLIESPVAKEVARMWWRIIWFGDTQASASTLTSGVDPELFKVCDGLFKRLMALPTSQVTTIAANSQTTTAAQFNALRGSGVAIKLVEDVLENADSRISSKNAKLFMTDSVAKAFTKDMRNTYKDLLTWQILENGLKISQFDGVDLVAVNTWDSMIADYENDGTKLNAPHRLVYASTEDLLVGTPENSVNADLQVTFNEVDRNTYMYATGKIGTLLGEDDLIHVAF